MPKAGGQDLNKKGETKWILVVVVKWSRYKNMAHHVYHTTYTKLTKLGKYGSSVFATFKSEMYYKICK